MHNSPSFCFIFYIFLYFFFFCLFFFFFPSFFSFLSISFPFLPSSDQPSMLLNRAHFQNTSCFCFVRLCHQNKYTSNVEAVNISQITLKGITVKCFWTVHGWASQVGWVTNPLLPLENFLPQVLGGIWHIFQLWFSNHETVEKKEEKYRILFSHKIN